ncbi:MAG: hypothetical protein WCO84_06955 [bacterium]
MKQLRFICAQPAISYYTWQVEVMINNFIDSGINPNYIDIVSWKENGVIPEAWVKLANHYNYVRFFFYDDTRITKHYTSSIRPNILKQHWQARPEIHDDAIFYHDNDIVFTKPINWQQFLTDDKWYGSDVRWYMSHDYIVSKGSDILDKMCEIVAIDKQIVKDNELNCIGAQYILKDIDYSFWDTVERDCERLFKEITDLSDQKVQEDRHTMPSGITRSPYHPLQIWCADMWAVLWNGWKRGKVTVCHDDLQFSWATSSLDEWNKFNIFHNAGVTTDTDGLFYKCNYMNKLPYNENLNIKENTASRMYWEYIQKTAKKSCLI